MRHRKSLDVIHKMRKKCRKLGVALKIVTKRGSHIGLVFSSEETGESFTLTITSHDELSPGVQRGCRDYVTGLVQNLKYTEGLRGLAEKVESILEEIFEGD